MKTGGSSIVRRAQGLVAQLVVGSMLLAGACAYGEVRQVLRAQFASETDCSDVTLAKRSTWYAEENPHQYKVTGCGVVRSYTCTEEQAAGFISYDEPACTWVEGDADAPKMKQHTSGDEAMEPMDYMDSEPPMDEPAAEPEEDSSGGEGDVGGQADSDFDAEASGDGEAPKAKAKAKAKGGFKLGSD